MSRFAYLHAAKKELFSDEIGEKSVAVADAIGLSRREMREARQFVESCFGPDRGCLPLTFVLTEWQNNARYMGADGKPIPLGLEAENGAPSLREILRTTVPNSEEEKVVDSLLDLGLISLEEEQFFVRERQFVPTEVSPLVVEQGGFALYALGSTVNENLFGVARGKTIERMAVSTRLHNGAVPRFLQYAKEGAKHLVDVTDAWVSANETRQSNEQEQYVGLGVYAFCVDDPLASGKK